MGSIAVMIAPSQEELSKWTPWLRRHLSGGVTIFLATYIAGASGDPNRQQLDFAQSGGADGGDDNFSRACVIAHGGDANHFFAGFSNEVVLKIAAEVKAFFTQKVLLPNSTVRVQICNAGRNPVNDTFQKNATPANQTSTAPRALSYLGDGGNAIDLAIWPNEGPSKFGKLKNMINKNAFNSDVEATFRELFDFTECQGIYTWDDEQGKHVWTLSDNRNKPAFDGKLKGKKPVKEFFLALARDKRPKGHTTKWHVDDIKCFLALDAGAKWSLVDYAIGGSTVTTAGT